MNGYSYTYNYPIDYYDISDSLFGAIMSIVMIVIAVTVIFWLVSYIFHAVGLYTIAKRTGRANPWLAFIPFARNYLHGEMAGVIGLKTRPVRNPGIWKLILPIIASVVFSVFYTIILGVIGVGTAFSYNSYYGSAMSVGTIMLAIVFCLIFMIAAVLYQGVYMVLCVLINIQIYGRFTSRNMAVAHAVLSAVVPLYESVCLFVMRNKDFNPGMEPEITPPPVPPVRPADYGRPENPVPPVPPVPPASPEDTASRMEPAAGSAPGEPGADPAREFAPEAPAQNTAPQPEASAQNEAPQQPEAPVQNEAPQQPEAPAQNETPQQPEPPVQ